MQGSAIQQARRRRAELTVAAAALIGVLGCAWPASARVLLVGGGTPDLPLVELSTQTVVARIAMPGPVSAVATRPAGKTGYAAAGSTLVEIDIDARSETRRVVLAGTPVSQLVTTRDGRLLALQGDRVTIVDPAGLAAMGSIALGAVGQQLSAGRAASRATVVLADGRVAILAVDEARVARSAPVPGATGAVIDGRGRTWVTAGRLLRVIPAGRRKASKRGRIALPVGVGGAVTLSPRDGRLAIGALPGATGGAIVNPATRRVRPLATGPGPGTPSWSLDATRVYMADGTGASVSIVGAASGRRLGLLALPGSTPTSVAEQPGLALLDGTEGPDTLTATGGADRIEGRGGDDYLRGGRGRDIVNGGPGDDRLSGGATSDEIDGGDGIDFLTGGAGDDTMSGGPGADGADGGTGNDTIDGGDGDDMLDGGDGDDTILGVPGNDRIVEKGFGNDKRLNGRPGDDLVEGGRGGDRIIEGEDGNDRLFGGPGKETISGGRGNDLLDGGRAADNLRGDEGDDELKGDAADDELDGNDGSDKLDGGSGADRIDGGPGNDTVTGGPGIDAIAGGQGTTRSAPPTTARTRSIVAPGTTPSTSRSRNATSSAAVRRSSRSRRRPPTTRRPRRCSTAPLRRSSFAARPARTRSSATAETTACSPVPATTTSTAETSTTSCMAAAATTSWPAATATIGSSGTRAMTASPAIAARTSSTVVRGPTRSSESRQRPGPGRRGRRPHQRHRWRPRHRALRARQRSRPGRHARPRRTRLRAHLPLTRAQPPSLCVHRRSPVCMRRASSRRDPRRGWARSGRPSAWC